MARNCQNNPLAELKDNIDLAFANFVKDSNLDRIIPKQLLPKYFEAEEEATVKMPVKFRTRPAEQITVTGKGQVRSTISQEDAKMKAQEAARMNTQEEAKRKVEDLKRSIDLASKSETKMFLDSSILDEYLETSDSKNYTLKKDLELNELDLELREGETLTIPEKVTLRNKRRISLLAKRSQIINKGNIKNFKEIIFKGIDNSSSIISNKKSLRNVYTQNSNMMSIANYNNGVITGTAPSASITSPSWPSIDNTEFITITNQSSSNFSNNFKSYESSGSDQDKYLTYTATYTFTQVGLGPNSTKSINITMNTSYLPSESLGTINVMAVGGGGGGGNSMNTVKSGAFYSGQGGYSGAIINNNDLPETSSNVIVTGIMPSITPTSGSAVITISNGSGGIGGGDGTITLTGINNIQVFGQGSSGQNTIVTISINNDSWTYTAPGGPGGVGAISTSPESQTPDEPGILVPEIYPTINFNNTLYTLSQDNCKYSCPTQIGGYIWPYEKYTSKTDYTIQPQIYQAGVSNGLGGLIVSGGGGGGYSEFNPNPSTNLIATSTDLGGSITKNTSYGCNGTNSPFSVTIPSTPPTYQYVIPSPLPNGQPNPNVGYGCGGGGAYIDNQGSVITGNNGGIGYTQIIFKINKTIKNPNYNPYAPIT